MKKRLMAIVAVMLTLVMVLASCASMDTFKKNLGDDYEIEVAKKDEIDDFAEEVGIDKNKYGISEIMTAANLEKGAMVVIIKCGSNSKADKLVDKLKDEGADEAGKIVAEGRFVLVGTKNAVNDALGK